MASRGRYQAFLTLAEGGMGRVELARAKIDRFERIYAVKRILPQFRDQAAMRAMFLEEARLAGLIRHANVIGVLDVGEDEDGPFLVMDYVEGLNLAQMLERSRELGVALPMTVALEIAIQIAAGLEAAHELVDTAGRRLELVHRDVSPQNVLVGFDGTVRVTDFGIARALGRSTKTDAGVVKGRLSFMSPEQLRYVEPDARSDLFALGIVLYRMVAGRHPFGTDPVECARNALEGSAPDLLDDCPSAPEALVELVFALLATAPSDRPSSAGEVRARLSEIRNEIARSEEAPSLSEHIAAHFAGDREAQREQLRSALASSDAAAGTGTAVATETAPVSARRRIAIVAAIAIAALVTTSALAWRATRSDEHDASPPAGASVSAPAGANAADPVASSPAAERDDRPHAIAPDAPTRARSSTTARSETRSRRQRPSADPPRTSSEAQPTGERPALMRWQQ